MIDPQVLAAERLKESGLSLDEAKRLRIKVLDRRQTKNLCGFNTASLKLQYHDFAGRAIDRFYRLRLLERAAFARGGLRYYQPPNTRPYLYLPRTLEWSKIADDTEVPLIITEGELKAACAAHFGLACAGLGGVSAWKSTKRNIALLPEFSRFKFVGANNQGRYVYLVFDSDLRTNPQVAQALGAFALELTRLGAQPFVVYLPDLEYLDKTGLDDYLVSEGDQPFHALLETAEPYELAHELWRLNAEVAYVRDPGVVVELATGAKIRPRDFKDHRYANRLMPALTAAGKITRRPAAAAWLAWPHRHEVAEFTYAPGQPQIADGKYNYWDGWAVRPKRGGVAPWRDLLELLFNGHRDELAWFTRWLAYPLQRPGVKLHCAAVLWGATHGTGKGLVGESMLKIYGKHGCEIGHADLHSAYNDWAVNRCFVMGDEIVGGEKRLDADRLKKMITQQSYRVNMKYVPAFFLPDRINYYFTSNHPDAFYLEDSDRRLFVHQVSSAPAPPRFYTDYVRWLSGDGPSHLLHHLLHLDLGDFNPRAPAPMTEAKALMIHTGKSDLQAWVAQLGLSPDDVLVRGLERLERDVYTAQELVHLYDPGGVRKVTAGGMGRELQRAGFQQVGPVRTKRGVKRLYLVRNVDRWASARQKEVVAHYDSKRLRVANDD